ncbi:MAG TPA: hypothetical protein VM934_05270 [Pyrinomonadaceae bacterium]|nr:hypothetical protein [Pyrinomonadaceae bacterium]
MTRLLVSCAAVLALCLSSAAQQTPKETPHAGRNEAFALNASARKSFFDSSSNAAASSLRHAGFTEPDALRRHLMTAPPKPSDEEAGEFAQETGAPGRAPEALLLAPVEPPPAKDKDTDLHGQQGFHWKQAFEQSLLLLAIQHGYAMTQPKTRRELRGPFLKDYFESLGNLHGWADGGRFFTNYLAHPLQGAATGFIQVQNDPKGMKLQFSNTPEYWHSRMKAFAWSAANSTQFELGPLSQAAIGNVGKARKLTYVDLVITPTMGTALLISEDVLDRYVVRRIEAHSNSTFLRVAARMLLNPSRGCANMLRFKKPWHRDNR